MKTKIIYLLTCMLILSLMVSLNALAQQQSSNPSNRPNPEITIQAKVMYTYQVFTAPNNAFGYDVYKNGKPIFHQFILTFITDEGKRSFVTKQQAQKAAAMAIEKIKKGMPPFMNETEIKKIAGQ